MSTTLAKLETELASLFAATAQLLEECYLPGSGRRMLGLPEDGSQPIGFRQVAVRETRIGKMLPVWNDYAYEGVVSAGQDQISWDGIDGALERLSDLIGLMDPENGYLEDLLANMELPDGKATTGHLADMLRRIAARVSLDRGDPLTLDELATLAEMNERSVRNAVHADGDARLNLDAAGTVSAEEARRWLAGRRNFRPTDVRSLPATLAEVPDSLRAVEIPAFVAHRLKLLAPNWGGSQTQALGLGNHLELSASQRCSLAPDRIAAAMVLPLNIRPEECLPLARLLELDPAWFTHQVMHGLFPEQIDMLLNPQHWAAAPVLASAAPKPPLQSVLIELNASMLAHGYLDIPIDASALFPDHAFGSKGSGVEGTLVEMRYGTHTATTDIRIKSSKTIAPRKRFNAWFGTELRAKLGDRIRIDKTAPGVYTLTHLPA